MEGVQVTSDNAGNVLAGIDNDGKVQYYLHTNTLIGVRRKVFARQRGSR